LGKATEKKGGQEGRDPRYDEEKIQKTENKQTANTVRYKRVAMEGEKSEKQQREGREKGEMKKKLLPLVDFFAVWKAILRRVGLIHGTKGGDWGGGKKRKVGAGHLARRGVSNTGAPGAFSAKNIG